MMELVITEPNKAGNGNGAQEEPDEFDAD